MYQAAPVGVVGKAEKNTIMLRNSIQGVGEVARRLRTLAALSEDPSLIPGSCVVAHNHP